MHIKLLNAEGDVLMRLFSCFAVGSRIAGEPFPCRQRRTRNGLPGTDSDIGGRWCGRGHDSGSTVR